MRIATALLAAAAALALTACESKADKAAEQQSDAIKAQGEATADAIENKADAVEAAGTPAAEATADKMDAQADATRAAAENKADTVEQAAGKKD